MSANALRTIWSLIALLSLTVAVLGFLRVAGVHTGGEGTVLEATGVFKYAPSEVATVSLPLQLVLVGIALYLSRLWTMQLGAMPWATRFPVFYFSSVDVDATLPCGSKYQSCGLILFLVLPVLVIPVMMLSYLKGTIYFTPTGAEPTISTGISGWGHFNTIAIIRASGGRGGFFRLGTSEGPQYIPWLTWVYLVLVAADIGYFLRVVAFGVFGKLNTADFKWVTRAGL
jgi:hypothetical protein